MEDDLWGNITNFLKEPKHLESEGILTENEIELAMLSFLEGRGEGGAEEEEIYRFIKWVEMVKLNNSLVDLMLRGIVHLDDPTGEFAPANDIVISLSEKGKQMQDELKSSN